VTIIQDGLLGLGTGGVYALLGIGMVLIYRGSGVVNFAHAAIAAVGAYVFWELHIKNGWVFLPACLVTMLATAAIGAAIHLLIMRPLRGRSSLARVAATLGVLSILTGAILLIWGDNIQIVKSSLPQSSIDLGSVTVAVGDLCLFGIALVLTGGLYAMTKLSRAGLAMTGVSENETATAALGWSPDSVATAAWAGGAALAGLAGVLAVPTTGLQVQQLTPLITFATAAALLGSFYSLPLTLLAGLGLGVAGSILTISATNPKLATVVPLAVIIFTLVIRGTSLPVRGFITDRLPGIGRGGPRPILTVLALLILAAVMGQFFGVNTVTAVTTQAVAAIILLSLVLLTGYAGQISLGQYAVAGCAAVYSTKLVTAWGWPFLPALILAMIGAAATGILVGLPALRTRGVSLAVVTLGLGYVIESVLLTSSAVTGGFYGTVVGGQTIFGLSVDPIAHPERYAILCLICFALMALAVANLRRGRVGRRLIAIRDNERAAASVGVSVTETKCFAFAASSAIAGLGGVLLAFSNPTVVFSNYSSANSLNSVANAVVGGIGFVTGPLIGSFFAGGSLGALFLDKVGNLGNWLPIISGVVLIVTLLVSPDGQVAEAVRVGKALGKRLPRPRLGGWQERLRRRSASRRLDRYLASGTEAEGARFEDRGALAISGLTVRLGGSLIVDDVAIQVNPGEVVGLIGPNGAGKTTVIDSVCGFVKPVAGSIKVGGTSLERLVAHRRVRTGVARSFQGLELFDDLTVAENVQAAFEPQDRLSYLTDFVRPRTGEVPSIVSHALRQCRLLDKLDSYPEELSYGQRRLVAIVRAVATGASVLLLDEPAAGLTDSETAELSALITWLAKACGAAVLLVEHDVGMVMGICDRVCVLQAGKMIASGVPAAVRANDEVVAAYLGT
jgi:ABC-type branched-subunit amino acid transport system ATPase component/branched-subunit amino acid ABC-type transport system permease component